MKVETLFLFSLASLSINLIPGPDVVYIVSNTMKGKVQSGTQAAVGLGIGYLFHTFAAVLGLSTLLLNSVYLFNIIKYFGAAYLLYLGLMSIKNCSSGKSKTFLDDINVPQGNIFKQGIFISILNPKVALFFLSFLPQFVDSSSGNTSYQLLVLGSFFTVLATCCNIVYAIIGSKLFNSRKVSKYNGKIEGLSGVLLVGLATKIVFDKN